MYTENYDKCFLSFTFLQLETRSFLLCDDVKLSLQIKPHKPMKWKGVCS
jgi:hypothetical protein